MTLKVIWTSGDKDVAMKMVHMYVYNAKVYEWWDDIELVIWGPSSKLLAEDQDLQDNIAAMLKKDIKVTACMACAKSYDVDEKLAGLGIDVKYMGIPLTEYLKSDAKVITF